MGIKNLFDCIRNGAPEAISTCDLASLRGMTIAIDASISIYQWAHVGKSAGIIGNHIAGALNRTMKLLALGIVPVYVFDGAPPISKGDTLARREQGSNIIADMAAIIDACRELFVAMGVRVIQAPSEAEAQAAWMVRNGAADAIATEDMDALAFGAPLMIRGFGSGDSVVIIDRAKVLAGLGLSSEQFTDLCILLGCDYTGTIRGVGKKRALDYLHECGNIERILATRTLDNSKMDYVLARAEFIRPIVRRIEKVEVRNMHTAINLPTIRALVEKWGVKEKRVDAAIKSLELMCG